MCIDKFRSAPKEVDAMKERVAFQTNVPVTVAPVYPVVRRKIFVMGCESIISASTPYRPSN